MVGKIIIRKGAEKALNHPALMRALAEIITMPICVKCDTPVKWCICEPTPVRP